MRLFFLNSFEMMKQERMMLITLAIINFTNIMDFMVMMPLAPQLTALFQLTPQQWSLVVSSYTFTAFVSGLLSLFFVDKFDRKPFLMVIYVGFIIGTLFCSMANSYVQLIAARILTGVFGGLIGATVLAIVGDAVPGERRASAMGIVMAGFSAAAALGVPFGLYFGIQFGWHVPFVAIVVMGLPILFMIWKFIPSLTGHLDKKEKTNPLSAIKEAFSDRNQFIALLFMVIMLFGQFSVIPFLSPYMVANVGFENFDLIYIYLIGGFASIFTSPIIGKLADKHGKTQVFTVLLLLSLIPLYLITNLKPTPVPIVLIITTFFFIFVGGRTVPGTALVLATAKPTNRGSFMTVRSSIQQLGSAVAAYVAGLVVVETPQHTYIHYQYVGYLAIATSLIALFLARKIKAIY